MIFATVAAFVVILVAILVGAILALYPWTYK